MCAIRRYIRVIDEASTNRIVKDNGNEKVIHRAVCINVIVVIILLFNVYLMFVDDNPTKVLLFITRREVRLRFSFQNMACRLLFIVKLKIYVSS